MVSPTQNREVVSWLRHNSHAPLVALDVWAELLTAMVWETGEVALTRDEIAANTGTRPNTISQIMGELESIGAISREREKIAGMRGPGRVKYIVNPTVCTHLTGPARVRAQAAALKLQVVSGGKA
jgi:predicted transcriptional regulator